MFHEGTLPSDFALDYETAIFNLQPFRILQDPTNWISFYILNANRKKAVASIHFHAVNQQARSPFRAPFGSVQFSKHLLPRLLYGFLEYVESQLRMQGIAELFIINPPHGYEPEQLSLLETFLLNLKYSVSKAEVSSLVQVSGEPYSEIIRPSENQRMRQAMKEALFFTMLPIEKLEIVYQFLSDCHAEKGYQFSLSLDDLIKTTNEFKERYLLFVILQGDKIVAASISVRINNNILYNFFANHHPDYNQLSPMILLLAGMYSYSRDNNIALIDLGTSALKGSPNFKLLDFKIHMGGMPSSKLSFYKKLK